MSLLTILSVSWDTLSSVFWGRYIHVPLYICISLSMFSVGLSHSRNEKGTGASDVILSLLGLTHGGRRMMECLG